MKWVNQTFKPKPANVPSITWNVLRVKDKDTRTKLTFVSMLSVSCSVVYDKVLLSKVSRQKPTSLLGNVFKSFF